MNPVYATTMLTLTEDGDLRREYESWTRQGQSACPVMAVPGRVKKDGHSPPHGLMKSVVEGKFGGRLTTLFWLPAEDPDINARALADLGTVPIVSGADGRGRVTTFLSGDTQVLLPFLSSVQSVGLYDGNERVVEVALEITKTHGDTRDISVALRSHSDAKERRFFQLPLDVAIPPRVRDDRETPRAVRQMKTAGLCLSIEIEAGQPKFNDTSPFHVYFPTSESTGLGLVVHGDFFVKPDRTSLMSGAYNDWLIQVAAQHLANRFLTSLLDRYEPRLVYEALRPVTGNQSAAAEALRSAFASALVDRERPFIRTRGGLATSTAVVLPPSPDPEGFWEQQFGDSDNDALPNPGDFLDPDTDSELARAFLEFAGVVPIPLRRLVDFIETAGADDRSSRWWYDCYEFMEQNVQASRWKAEVFVSRQLVPVGKGEVAAVEHRADPAICLPPSTDMAEKAPPLFQPVFRFMDSGLAELLYSGPEPVRTWVLDRFGVVRFEATDLLPRAVRLVVGNLFSGRLPVSCDDLVQAWTFAYRMIESSREIESRVFWSDLGRLPVPLATVGSTGRIPTTALAPAFLTFWPDTHLPGANSCIHGVPGLRRMASEFIDRFESSAGIGRDRAIEFWSSVGVADGPRALTYRRMPGENSSPEIAGTSIPDAVTDYHGGRQIDENRAASQVLAHSPAWGGFSLQSPVASPSTVLQVVRILEGFSEVVQQADREFKADGPLAQERLRSLWLALARNPVEPAADTVFDRTTNDAATIGRFIGYQLETEKWLPTTRGPAPRGHAFHRLETRRLISPERDGSEIGDQLLPYVLANSADECAALERLGVRALEDVDSADPAALLQALQMLGTRLAESDANESVIGVHSRWRPVRGAIQEIYRRLNKCDGLTVPSALRLATHSAGRIEFVPKPWYFAQPGSPAERAFCDDLPMIEVDRKYGDLFSQLGVLDVSRENGLDESFAAEERSAPSETLRSSIVKELALYLLAVVIARSEERGHRELVLRRLRERFAVKVADELTVSFKYKTDVLLERQLAFGSFYLKREIVPGQGALREAQFTLYVKGDHDVALLDLDGDALGAALVPLFVDQGGRQIEGIFPRVVSKYQKASSPEEMSRFMYEQLEIPIQTQIAAKIDVLDPTLPAKEAPPPPPVVVVPPIMPPPTGEGAGDHLADRRDDVDKDIAEFFDDLSPADGQGEGRATTEGPPRRSKLRTGGPSSEQRARGKRGEEEFLRRVNRAQGWEGFTLKKDTREPGWGFDFLCTYEGRVVKVEVKTFSRDGRIVLSANELRVAAASREDYFLIGFLDDGSPEAQWRTGLCSDPIRRLLRLGTLSMDAKLEAEANQIFDLSGSTP